MAKEHAGEVYRPARDRDWAASNSDVVLSSTAGDSLAVGLERDGEVEVVPVPNHEVLRGSRRGEVWVVALRRCTRLEVECTLEGLVALSDLLLRYTRQLAYFTERPWDGGLPTGDEDACGDDGVDTFPA